MTIGILSSCSNDDDTNTQTVTMRVNHYQNTGIAEGLFLTLLVQEGDNIGTTNWNRLYTTIEGFNYVPGHIYDLSVAIEDIDNPPADASSLKYTLLKIISTQDVDDDTLFEINLKINGQSFMTSSSGYQILNEITIDCNTLCDELDSRLENQDFVVGTFKRLDTNEIQLMEVE